MTRLLPRPVWSPASTLSRAMLTATALLLAMGVRLVLTPWLEDRHPLTSAVPLVAVVSILCGVRWALLLAAATLVWVALPWLPPNWPHDSGSDPLDAGLLVLALCTPALASLLFEPPPAEIKSEPARPLVGAQRALWGSALLALLLPLALLAVFSHRSRMEALAGATQRAESALRIASEHVTRVLQANELIARQIHAQVTRVQPARPDGTLPALQPFLAELARDVPYLNSLWLLGDDGFPVASSLFASVPRINYADREYFVFHREHRGTVYVSRLLLTRSTQELFFDVSLRWESPDGRFLGVINVTLKPQYFVQFFREITATAPGVSLTLLRDDGFVLARSHGPLGVGERVGEARGAAGKRGEHPSLLVGGGAGLAAPMHELRPYPLRTVAALDREAVLQEWREQVAVLGGLSMLAALALLSSLWSAWHRTRDEVRAVERLAEEAQERRRAEERLRQAQKLNALGQLTGSVAHDFNNVLSVLQNHVVLLERTQGGLAGSGALAALRRAIENGEHLTRKLLAFSRQRPLAPQRLDLGHALPAIEEILRMSLGGTIKLQINVVPGTPSIDVDRAELELAMLNLATNARAAMSSGGEVVIVARPLGLDEEPPSARTPDSRPLAVVISVRDNGAGMDRETLARVREPFFTTKPEGEGTGLGLSQVEALCRESGGAMAVDSTPGRGTTVHLYFAAAADEAT